MSCHTLHLLSQTVELPTKLDQVDIRDLDSSAERLRPWTATHCAGPIVTALGSFVLIFLSAHPKDAGRY
jgi:hypothetical protein